MTTFDAQVGSEIPAEILQHPVAGLNLRPGSFGAQLDGRPTLLCFLRHFG